MRTNTLLTIAAAAVATIVVSLPLSSCQGRKASNMVPLGETVEVVIDRPAEIPDTVPPTEIPHAEADAPNP